MCDGFVTSRMGATCNMNGQRYRMGLPSVVPLRVERVTVIRLSVNPSVRAVLPTGTRTAVSHAVPIGTSLGSMIGMGVTGWAGLGRTSESHSSHSEISFARLVTISEKRHQVGVLGDPPKVSRKVMHAILPKIAIDCAAAEATWFIRR
jgi:hypothetical protein